MEKAPGWEFEDGADIAPGLRALKALGGGTTCEVWLAWDEALGSRVACKALRPRWVGDAGALRVLRRESRLLARLAHPVIVRRFNAQLEGPRPHLVLEHVPGRNLRRRLRKAGPLALEDAVALGRRLCSALRYLAAEGVVHLDVKPSNILHGETPRLIDFSLARSLERARALKRPVGTAKYMAPEQCAPELHGPVGPAADIWSLGVTLYEAITGELPFRKGAGKDATDPAARYPQLVEAPAAPPAGLAPPIRDALMACLRRKPGERPDAAQLAAALK